MKKFKNGVPKLSISAKYFVSKLIMQGALMNAGMVTVNINPKNHCRGKKLGVAKVAFIGKEVYLWYKGYHYRYVLSGDWVLLNLRDNHIIQFYKQLYSLKKKGCKNTVRRIRM